MSLDRHIPAESARLRVAAFTGSKTISSRRFRVAQYLPFLKESGIDVDEFIARLGSWPPERKALRPLWLAGTILDRIGPIVRSHRYDLTLFQRELVSTLLTLEPFSNRPRILDVDDAVWLTSSRALANFSSLVRLCDGVICGNSFIADAVSQWNQEVVILPTAVDTDRFSPAAAAGSADRQIVGWSGLSSGSKYLLGVEPALYDLLTSRSDVVLRVVSDSRPPFKLIDETMYEFLKWTPEVEVRTIQEMSIGLMPIDDTPWSRGKCSYKMLLYMSCGLPVVVSPYGMNLEVLSQGNVGLGPKSLEDWTDGISWLLDNPQEGHLLGANGRRLVESQYSLTALAPRLGSYLLNHRR